MMRPTVGEECGIRQEHGMCRERGGKELRNSVICEEWDVGTTIMLLSGILRPAGWALNESLAEFGLAQVDQYVGL